MPDFIKYSTSAQTLALKEGDFYIGTGDVSKATTAITDYWNGVTPPTGGYAIYLSKATQGPSIFIVANDAELITGTNLIGSQSFTTAAQCFNWYLTQPDKMVLNSDYPPIRTDGLLLNYTAGFVPSYPKNGTTIYDLSVTQSGNGTLTNGPTYNAANNGYLQLDGSNDHINCGDILKTQTNTFTINIVATLNQTQLISSGNYIGTLFGRFGTASSFRDYQITVRNLNNAASATQYQIGFTTTSQGATASTDNVLGTASFSTTPRVFTFSQDAGVLSYYLDGVFVRSVTPTQYTPAPSTRVAIGLTDNSTKSQYLRGRIHQVLFYNVALNSTQVTQLYNSGLELSNAYDTDALAFFNAAGITDLTQKVAVNQLVLDLKAYGIYTKINALYPFVGGTATTHKYNLKNPLDTDAAFRIVFSGGWTHDSNGITSDGTTAYARTFVKMNTSGQIGNRANHWSSYNRSFSTLSSSYNGLFDTARGVQFGWGRFQTGGNNNWWVGLQSWGNTNVAASTGFINGSCTLASNNGILYKNGVSIFTAAFSSLATANEYYLGAMNENGTSIVGYNDTNVAFASLGSSSLTAVEAANFYIAVQKFQTTLGRQV